MTALGVSKRAAAPMPSAKPPLEPATVVTTPVAMTTCRMRWVAQRVVDVTCGGVGWWWCVWCAFGMRGAVCV